MLSLTLHLMTAGLLAGPPAEPAPTTAGAAAPASEAAPAAAPSEANPDAAALAPAERPADAPAAPPAAKAEPTTGPAAGEAQPAPSSLPSLTGPGDETVGGQGAQSGPPVSPVAPAAPAPAPSEPTPSVSKPAKKKSYPLIPIRWRAEVGIGGGTATFFDPATKAVSDAGRYSRFDITARGDARLGDGRLFLGGVAGYRGFTTDTGDIYDVADLELELREPYFALRLAVMAIEGVDVFVEAGGGPSLYRTEFKTTDRHYDETVSGYAMGQAGVMLYLPKKWLIRKGSSRVTVGLELGVGGAYRPDLDLSPVRKTPDDPIDTGKLQLGNVNLSGVTWRAGLFVRFM